MRPLLALYLGLRLLQQVVETLLAALNRRYAAEETRLATAADLLGIGPGEMAKAVAYSGDRYRFGLVSGWIETTLWLGVLAAGGLGLLEGWANTIAAALSAGALGAGLAFFAMLGLAGALFSVPFELYSTFHVEQRHGFNRQTLGGFFLDRVKGLGIAVALGAPFLASILWLMQRMGPSWWLWAWGVAVAFNLLTVWIYPAVLAPIFNRFTPLAEGELRERILALARHVGFRAGGIYVMDASRRTAHGNAYFTGLFGQKRIVLFDTLVAALSPREVAAVLAHELGHFKLHHVRWAVLRGLALSGLVFYALARLLPISAFYTAFALDRTAYGALLVFGLWFSLLAFLMQPFANAISRRQERAADAFALRSGASGVALGGALRRLRETSKLLPVSHPLYSRVYHSHPPLLERLREIGGNADGSAEALDRRRSESL